MIAGAAAPCEVAVRYAPVPSCCLVGSAPPSVSRGGLIMSPKPPTTEQFLDFLAKSFRDRAKKLLAGSWTSANLAKIFDALNAIPGPPAARSTACPQGGDQIGTCTYRVGGR